MITYSLQSGELPPGLDIKDSLIDGLVLWANGGAPTWDTQQDSFLGSFNDNTTVSLPALEVTAAEGRTIASYQIVGRMYQSYTSIPFGLVLDRETGAISGTVIPTGEVSANPWLPSEQPIWNTESGQIADLVKYQTASSLAVSATAVMGTSISRYFITRGSLPMGLSLDSQTGAVTGTVSDSNILGDYTSPDPRPTWNTIPGSLGNVNERQTVTINLSATANLGTSISRYFITRGALPYGLSLNTQTGEISGTTSDILTSPLEPEYHYPGPDWVTASDLGSAVQGMTFSVSLSATPPEARLLAGFYIIPGASTGQLPRGLSLDYLTGVISGTPLDVGSFTFIVNAVDSAGNFSSKDFTLVVTAA